MFLYMTQKKYIHKSILASLGEPYLFPIKNKQTKIFFFGTTLYMLLYDQVPNQHSTHKNKRLPLHFL